MSGNEQVADSILENLQGLNQTATQLEKWLHRLPKEAEHIVAEMKECLISMGRGITVLDESTAADRVRISYDAQHVNRSTDKIPKLLQDLNQMTSDSEILQLIDSFDDQMSKVLLGLTLLLSDGTCSEDAPVITTLSESKPRPTTYDGLRRLTFASWKAGKLNGFSKKYLDKARLADTEDEWILFLKGQRAAIRFLVDNFQLCLDEFLIEVGLSADFTFVLTNRNIFFFNYSPGLWQEHEKRVFPLQEIKACDFRERFFRAKLHLTLRNGETITIKNVPSEAERAAAYINWYLKEGGPDSEV